MSFILDALKKLEHKRQRGSVPDLLTVHEPMPKEPKQRPLWPYLVFVALLLNAGILTVWLSPWQSENQVIVTQSTATDSQQHKSKAIESGQQVTEVPLPASAPSPEPIKALSPEDKATKQEPLPESITPVVTPVVKPVDVAPDPEPILTIPAAEPQPPADIESVSDQKVLNMHELPLSVQQDLPKLTITGHIYSNDPSSRLVNINGQLIREGEDVTKGMRLEEITSNGVILSYKGYRFRIRGF